MKNKTTINSKGKKRWSIKLKNMISSFKEECKECSEQQKTISDAWIAIETLSDLNYEQAVEILKILKTEKDRG